MFRQKITMCLASLLFLSPIHASAEISIVASIKPIHSLVSAVMEGVASPEIIIDGANSPHDFSLKPSQARILQNADIVFWIGHEFETSLDKSIKEVAKDARSVELMDVDGLTLLEYRDFDVEEEGHGKEHEHEGEHKAEHKGEHEDEHEHAHGEFDPHIWLDPKNASILVDHIASTLAEFDTANADKYNKNALVIKTKLNVLLEQISSDLAGLNKREFFVFHDGYHYFENRFGFDAKDSISITPENKPGAEHISDIRGKITAFGDVCVFSEPQFESKILSALTDGTSAKVNELDPIGAKLENGSELYFQLLANMAEAFRNCLDKNN